jgi:glutamate--cysteine ligase catalytic subunit
VLCRDTISLFGEKVNQNDDVDTDHFENIQSTNWQTMRFKPPPPNSAIGWRVEFRPCELQFTDFENAAIATFVVLLTRVILSFKYNLLIPISNVDANMKRAQKRDAVREQKFFFRTNITTTCDEHAAPTMAEMTIGQIINGDASLGYPGLLPLVQEFLRDSELDASTMCTLSNCKKFLHWKAAVVLSLPDLLVTT